MKGRPSLWLGAVLSVLFVVLGPIAAIAETSPSDEATSTASPTVEPDGVTGPEPTGPTGPTEEPTDAIEGETGVPATDLDGPEESVDDASVT
ncbi:MAG TPA: hypothetical protein VFZ96_10765, partial [Actinomycetota bacterium]|nr:hypothetical protein [Actinomycetota bacterium]